MSRPHSNDPLAEAIDQITSEPIDADRAAAAAARVWEHLAELNQPTLSTAVPASGVLLQCADMQNLIPSYLRGELTPARALLLEDHTRSCVPCRRALRATRNTAVSARVATAPTASSELHHDRKPVYLAIAAVLIAAVGLGLVYLYRGTFGNGAMARIEAVEGGVYQVSGTTSARLAVGAVLAANEEIRTARGSRAMVRMTDGSLIEMGERAGFSLRTARDGNTIALDRGRIIVQAAHQRPRHLYVDSGDCLVSVTGTVFAVNHGTKGTRVSVVEGEVRVQEGNQDHILHPGGQVNSQANMTAVPVREEFAWSTNSAQYQKVLTALTAAGKDIDAQIPPPGLRNSTHLLDLVPSSTTVYVALPNLTGSLSATEKLLEQHMSQNEDLAQWWGDSFRSPQAKTRYESLIQQLGDLGRDLGPEIAIAVPTTSTSVNEPVLIAEVTNPTDFTTTLAQEIQTVNAAAARTALVLVSDPASAPSNTNQVLLWVGNGLFVATRSATLLQEVAAYAAGGPNPFVANSFRSRVAESYADGAGWLFAADLGSTLNSHRQSIENDSTLEALGIYDLQHFVLNYRQLQASGETRAALTFAQPRRGVASWLALPGPMGGLSYFSGDTNLAVDFLVKSPVALLDEIVAASPEFAAQLAEAQAKEHFDLREDLAKPLGGEIALGIDGPLLPTPSWKMVIEVEDPARLEQTIEQAITQINAAQTTAGRSPVTLTNQVTSGQTFYTVTSTQPNYEIHYVFSNGYLIIGPSLVLIEQALEIHAAGTTLAASPKFHDLLGQDGQVNLSAVVYRNFNGLGAVSQILGMAAGVGKAGRTGAHNILASSGPGLFYAYAEDQQILFGGRSSPGALGFNLRALAGFRALTGGILRGAAAFNESQQ
jgi:hypothetical protein